MQIIGIDFTSAPKPKKPIVAALCSLQQQVLTLEGWQHWTDLEAFGAFLKQPSHWIAAMDFPFSMPASWLQEMGWPTAWAESVDYIQAHFNLAEFCREIKRYRQLQPAGKKLHFRPIDRLAGACSPMTIDYTPVGRMFYQGAPQLLAAKLVVPPFHSSDFSHDGDYNLVKVTTQSQKVALEGYPALIARRLAPKQPYKSDTPKLQSLAHRQARQSMVSGLQAQFLAEEFGFEVDLQDWAHDLVQDPTGDCLDALFCALQAAWASQQPNFGIPQSSRATEGWICDPGLSGLEEKRVTPTG